MGSIEYYAKQIERHPNPGQYLARLEDRAARGHLNAVSALEIIRRNHLARGILPTDPAYSRGSQTPARTNETQVADIVADVRASRGARAEAKQRAAYLRFRTKHPEWESQKHRREYGSWSAERKLFEGAKDRAREKGLEFTIHLDDIVIPAICPVLGIPIVYSGKGSGRNWNAPSLDRIDSARGYTTDNICVISWRANAIKSFGTAAEHEAIAQYIRSRK